MSDPTIPSSPAVPAQPETIVETPAPLAYESPRPEHEQLGKKTLRGGLWTIGGYAGVQVVRLASNLILTRIFLPDWFGVMLIVNTVMTGIRLFSDVGIGPAVIANPRGDTELFLRTAWTTQILRGFAIWIVSVAIAYPIAQSYAAIDPITGLAAKPAMLTLAYLLPVAGFVAVIEGFRSTAVFRLQRGLRFAEQQLLDIIEIVVVAVGMVVWAYVAVVQLKLPPERAVWALVVPPLLGALAATVTSHFLLRDRRDKLGWDKTCAAELMKIGRWVFLSTALLFLAGQFDRLIFGKLVSESVLGVYGQAATLAAMPAIAVMKVGQSVLFPTFSRVAQDPVRFVGVYRRARTMLLVIAAMMVSGMIAAGPFAVHAMYDARFEAAGWMLQLLALGIWFQIVDATNVAGLLAREHPHWMAGGNATKVVFMFALVPIAFYVFGHHGAMTAFGAALVALAIADALRALASTAGLLRIKTATATTLLPDLVLPIAAGVTGWIGLKLANLPFDTIANAIGGGPKVHRLLVNGSCAAIAGGFVLLVWTPICLWQWKASRRSST